MKIEAANTAEYINQIPEDRKAPFQKIIDIFRVNLPEGFEEGMNYNMPSFYVPHSRYPDGYHCDPKAPLPFISVASQKNFIAFYHSGIYANPTLHDWFVSEYHKHCKRKLDMGKSCIRLKKMDDIPFQLIEELAAKITVDQWIETYESRVKG